MKKSKQNVYDIYFRRYSNSDKKNRAFSDKYYNQYCKLRMNDRFMGGEGARIDNES